jgi:hypothetical protein
MSGHAISRRSAVSIENLNPDVVMMKSAKDRGVSVWSRSAEPGKKPAHLCPMTCAY